MKKKKWDDPEFEEFYQSVEENNAWYILLFMIVFILFLSLGITELIVWFICMITGIPFSFLLGFAGWILFLFIRYEMIVRINNED